MVPYFICRSGFFYFNFYDCRDVLEVRDSEYRAWACVQSLKSRLDEQNLELRVKKANEAEAISQQKLAAAEAEIADLRQKLEASKRLNLLLLLFFFSFEFFIYVWKRDVD